MPVHAPSSSRSSWASTCAFPACTVFRVQAVACTAARVLCHKARTQTRTHARAPEWVVRYLRTADVNCRMSSALRSVGGASSPSFTPPGTAFEYEPGA